MIKGCYHDILTDSHGRVRWDGGWHSNRVVHSCGLLLAALMKGQPEMQGILYWAVGEGEKDWDALCPSPQPDDTHLVTEVARQALAPEQIVYLDDDGAPSRSPTTCLEVTAEFAGNDLVSSGFQSLREFGLFGGDATEGPDSGFMIDYVIHPRIDLPSGDTLSRNLRLTFTTDAIWQEEVLAGFGAALPVNSIDGVGDAYASALHEHGIRFLGDLARIDPLRPIGNIPPARLREFRAKARLVMGLRVSQVSLGPLANHSVSRFLLEKPESLSRPGVTLEEARHLQEALAGLQIALDNAQLKRITLADLVNR
jgi:hypothetical protein